MLTSRMLALPLAALGLGLILGSGACSDGSTATKKEVCNNKVDDDGNGLIDCADPGCKAEPACQTPQPDSGPQPDGYVPPDSYVPKPDTVGPQPDGAKPASPLQAVMNKLIMPTSSNDYARDIDGNSTLDNRLGGIIGTILAFAPTANLQGSIDAQIDSGALILLFDVMSSSLTDDPAMQIVVAQGNDLDVPANPVDNFSGSEEFALVSSGPVIKINGKIVTGKLTADGDVTMAIPVGATPTVVTLKKGRIEADVSASGLVNGVVTGAIPTTEVNSTLIPAIAQMMNDPLLDPAIKTLFDSDKDGTITAAELQNNILIKLLLLPDVDTDGDNKPDALSVGVGFNAVSCKIQPY